MARPIGWKFSEESRRKMSEKAKENVKSRRSYCGENNPNYGKKQSIETRYKIGSANRGKKYTEEEKRKQSERLKKVVHTPLWNQRMRDAKRGIMPKVIQQPGSYGHIKRGWFDINGKKLFFRSTWEANYALYLDFLIKQNQIKSWEGEKDVFIFEAIKFGTRSYRPDFKITNLDDSIEYHEVKGYMDSQSLTKLKRMRIYYPKVKIILIDGDSYTDIQKKLGRMLNFF